MRLRICRRGSPPPRPRLSSGAPPSPPRSGGSEPPPPLAGSPSRGLLLPPAPGRHPRFVPRRGLLDRVRLLQAAVVLGELGDPLVVVVQHLQLVLAQVLDVDEPAARSFERRDDLVQLQVDGPGVVVLRPLDQ